MLPLYSPEGDCSMVSMKDCPLPDISIKNFKCGYIKKIILSSAPPHCIAFLIYGTPSSLAIARFGDPVWPPVRKQFNRELEDVQDAVYNEKEDKLYAVLYRGSIVMLNLKNYHWGSLQPPEATTVLCAGPVCKFLDVKKYIVFSSGGDLLQIWRVCKEYAAETISFEVFKYKPGHSDGKNPDSCWVHVNDLGDEVMFLGLTYSTCVSTLEKSCLGKNLIYFAEDRLFYRSQPHLFHSRAGIFYLKSNRMERFFPGDFKDLCQPAAWFIPNHFQLIL